MRKLHQILFGEAHQNIFGAQEPPFLFVNGKSVIRALETEELAPAVVAVFQLCDVEVEPPEVFEIFEQNVMLEEAP